VTEHEVRRLLRSMPAKSSPLDVLPCSLLKTCTDVFAPAIARLANLSLQTGVFSTRYKQAQVLPVLRKAGLDTSAPGNYRSILTGGPSTGDEEACVGTSAPHLLSSRNFGQFQSAYRKQHSTETALLEVLDSVYTAADDKQVTVLVGLDLSAAFDTVSHDTLLQRSQTHWDPSCLPSTAVPWVTS